MTPIEEVRLTGSANAATFPLGCDGASVGILPRQLGVVIVALAVTLEADSVPLDKCDLIGGTLDLSVASFVVAVVVA